MDWLKKAPTALVVTLIIVTGVLVLGVLAGYVVLSYTGQPTDDYTRFINTIANLLGIPLISTAVIASVSAAKSASKAEQQTNGGPDGLRHTVKQAVREVNAEEVQP